MKIIMLGAPGAGKGTQAEVIASKYEIPTISTGNIIREAIKNKTEIGLKVKDIIESGKLVSDDIVIEMVSIRIKEDDCNNGFILDGFPRTIAQAEALKDMGVEIDKVVDIYVNDDTIVSRLSNRRVCESCGKSFHMIFNPPSNSGDCTKCGGKAVQRKDDEPETILNRLKEYQKETKPLEDYYANLGKLVRVEGQEEIADTTKLTLEAVEA